MRNTFRLLITTLLLATTCASPSPALAQRKPPEPEPPSVPVERTVRFPSATVEDVVRAGSGRYLLLHLPRMRAVTVLDLPQRKVARYLPVDSDAVRMAGGATKAVVALNDKGLLQRWDLNTFQLDSTVKLPGPPGAVAMGSASEGPVLCGREFLDLATLARMPVAIKTHRDGRVETGYQYMTFDTSPVANITARADGEAFLSGRHVLVFRGPADADVYSDWPIHPNWPGIEAFRIIQHRFQIAGGRPKFDSEVAAPSADDEYFVMVEFKSRTRHDMVGVSTDMMTVSSAKATVRRVSDGRVFSDPIRLEEFDFVGMMPIPGMPMDRRLYFDPATGVLVTIPVNGDRVLFRTVWRDLRER